MNKNPFLSTDFHIAWSTLESSKAVEDTRLAIQQAQAAIDAICALKPEEISYDNTFAAMEEAPMPVERAWHRLNHLKSVCDSPERREALNELLPEVSMFSAAIGLNPALYAVLKQAAAADWVKELSPIKQRFIAETMTDFRESGAELSDEDKQRYMELTTRMAELSQQFGERVLDSTNAWEYVTRDESELAGLPESAREAARLDALSKGYGSEEEPQWRFNLQVTSLFPVLTYADKAALRERVWRGSSTKGTGEFNTAPLIQEILELRQQKAQLMGYKCYSDYVLNRRMAQTGQRALDFVDGLHDKVKQAFDAEQEALRLFAEEQSGSSIPTMEPWSLGYWSEKRRQALYNFDSEELRPYFGMQRVLDGMFELFSGLYGIKITAKETFYREEGSDTPQPAGTVEVWHPDVLFFELHDVATGEHLGSFYADWYPRETKRAGAWMDCLSCGMPPVGGAARVPHLGLMCGNMSKPVGDKPALLTHDEVATVFHEFGHLLHQLLSDVEVRSLAGCNVAWDFVELPSQINENWTWQREALERFACHWESGASLPVELLDKMLAAKNYGAASFAMRQLSFGKMDLELHVKTGDYLAKDIKNNLEQIDREVLSAYRVPVTEQANSALRAFSHIFDGGYESGYYSYKWAEMLEADAFSRFMEEGIFNPATGRDFRKCILSKGNSKPAAELYRDFMHRDPDADAMLRRDGII